MDPRSLTSLSQQRRPQPRIRAQLGLGLLQGQGFTCSQGSAWKPSLTPGVPSQGQPRHPAPLPEFRPQQACKRPSQAGLEVGIWKIPISAPGLAAPVAAHTPPVTWRQMARAPRDHRGTVVCGDSLWTAPPIWPYGDQWI